MATNVGIIVHPENLEVGNHDFDPETQAPFAFVAFELKQKENSMPDGNSVSTLQGKAKAQHLSVLRQK